MQITIDRQSGTPIYMQIANQLRRAIHDGESANGSRLPPERRLAALLAVNRTTIVNAYRELAADGLVSGQVGRGTVVTYGALEAAVHADDANWDARDALPRGNGHGQGNGSQARGDVPAPIPWAQLFTAVTDVMDDPLLHDAMTASARPDVIRFATGIPSPELYPIELIRELFDEALHQSGQALLQYTPTEGYPPLRDELAAWMSAAARRAGTTASFDARDVIVVAGSQQGLYLLARTLIEPGDLVAIESPTYLGAAQVFRAAGARLLPIPVDADGMQVDILHDILARRRPKLIYTLADLPEP